MVDAVRYSFNLLFPSLDEIEKTSNLIKNTNRENENLKLKHEIKVEKFNKTKSKIKIKL